MSRERVIDGSDPGFSQQSPRDAHGPPSLGGYRVGMLPPIDDPAAPERDAHDGRAGRRGRGSSGAFDGTRRRGHRSRGASVVVTLLGIVLLLTGCIAPKNQASAPTPRSSQSAGPLSTYYDQELEWSTCDQGE